MNLLINIDVPDLAKAEAFYTEAFGLRCGRRLGDGFLEMLGAEAPFYLLKKEAGSIGAADSVREYGRHWMPLHIDVVVDDLESALARALEAGALQEGDI